MVIDRARVLSRLSCRLGIHRAFLGERGTKAAVKNTNVSIVYDVLLSKLPAFSLAEPFCATNWIIDFTVR